MVILIVKYLRTGVISLLSAFNRKSFLFFLAIVGLLNEVMAQVQEPVIHYLQEEILFQDIKYKNPFSWSSHKDTILPSDQFAPNYDVVFNRQPGIIALNGENTAQDVRLSVRGFGARAAFGIRGIKVYQDGIPLSSPDGTTQLDEMSLYNFHQLEVVRSGFSARLGNGSGGAVSVKSEPYFSGISAKLRFHNTGAYDAGVSAGYSFKKVTNLFSINHHRFQSARDHADGQNTVLYNKTRWSLNDRWLMETILHAYYSPEGKDPGALNAAEFLVDPLQANPRNVLFNAGEEVKGINVAFKSSYYLTKNQKLYSTLFHKIRDFSGRLAFRSGGYVDLNRNFSGLHNVYEFAFSDQKTLSFGQGIEYQDDLRQRFENLEGKKGAPDINQNERVTNIFLFQQWQQNFAKWGFHQLVRYDYFKFGLSDNFLSDGKQDGSTRFSNVQASVGLHVQPGSKWNSYLNAGTGFETPTLNEFTNNPEGMTGLNTRLKPEKSIQAEWGNRFSLTDNLTFQTALYWIQIQDMITGYETDSFPGRTFYRNAGKTRRFGWEMNSSFRLAKNLTVSLQYAWTHYTYLDYTLSGQDYSGRFQPAIPKHRWVGFIRHNIKNYMEYSLQCLYQGKMFADDANTETANRQTLLHLTLSSGKKVMKNMQFGVFFNNILQSKTYSNIRVNAAMGRYFEAMSPAGVAIFLSYRFAQKTD